MGEVAVKRATCTSNVVSGMGYHSSSSPVSPSSSSEQSQVPILSWLNRETFETCLEPGTFSTRGKHSDLSATERLDILIMNKYTLDILPRSDIHRDTRCSSLSIIGIHKEPVMKSGSGDVSYFEDEGSFSGSEAADELQQSGCVRMGERIINIHAYLIHHVYKLQVEIR